MFKAPPPILSSTPASSSPLLVHPIGGVCCEVCVGPWSSEQHTAGQRQVHVLKCDPRDGTHYPCALHQQGPRARAGSWPFVSKQMETGREAKRRGGGETREEMNGNGEGEKKRVSLFSLTLGIEGVAALTMRQQPWMVPLSFRLTLLPSVQWTCHKVCVQCIHYPILHVPIWHVNMPRSWALNLFTICFPIVVSLMFPGLKGLTILWLFLTTNNAFSVLVVHLRPSK